MSTASALQLSRYGRPATPPSAKTLAMRSSGFSAAAHGAISVHDCSMACSGHPQRVVFVSDPISSAVHCCSSGFCSSPGPSSPPPSSSSCSSSRRPPSAVCWISWHLASLVTSIVAYVQSPPSCPSCHGFAEHHTIMRIQHHSSCEMCAFNVKTKFCKIFSRAAYSVVLQQRSQMPSSARSAHTSAHDVNGTFRVHPVVTVVPGEGAAVGIEAHDGIDVGLVGAPPFESSCC